MVMEVFPPLSFDAFHFVFVVVCVYLHSTQVNLRSGGFSDKLGGERGGVCLGLTRLWTITTYAKHYPGGTSSVRCCDLASLALPDETEDRPAAEHTGSHKVGYLDT